MPDTVGADQRLGPLRDHQGPWAAYNRCVNGGNQHYSHPDIVFATTAAVTTEAFVRQVASRLAGRGYCVELASGDRDARIDFPATTAVVPMERPISLRADVRAMARWIRYLRHRRPSLLVAGTPKASLLSLVAARLVGVPGRVYVLHGAVWDGALGTRARILRIAERLTLASATDSVAVSPSLAALVEVSGLMGHRKPPAVLGSGSFCGVDVARFTPNDETPAGRRICFVGRLNRDKGLDVLLRVFDIIRREIPEAELSIIGGLDESNPPDDETLKRLRRHPAVSWEGAVDDVVGHLQRADILLFPSRREGLGQVVLEAQACGVPVVSWRVTGVVDAVRDGETGRLVEYGDESGLAAAAVALLADESLRDRCSKAGRTWVVENFDEAVVAERMAGYLEAILTRDSTTSAIDSKCSRGVHRGHQHEELLHQRRWKARGNRFYRRYGKRALDLALGVPMAVCSLPLQALLAALIRKQLGAPVLFRQARPGRDGRVFAMVKFRTMSDARDATGDLLPDEERITALGRLLRNLSLDELPELWNVLRGEMSLVGPRPLLRDYLHLYTEEQSRRHEVRPGLTGLAQVQGRNDLAWARRFQLDVEYVDNLSLALDLKILYLTLWRVLARSGISAEGHVTAPRFDGSH